MPKSCWAAGCTSGYRSNDEKRHFFKVPSDSQRLAVWRRFIPRNGSLTSKHYLCDKHFENRFIIKKDIHVINGEKVELDRGKWELTKDAVPTIFPNLPKYYSSRKRKTRVIQSIDAEDNETIVAPAADEQVKDSVNPS